VGSAAILTLVRRWTTDQDLLRRVAADKKRLGALLREARKRGDRDAVRRLRATKPRVAMKAFRQEGLPLAVSILPIAMLATWCLLRLDYHPPAAGEAVEVVAYTPLSAAGHVMHLVPQDGLESDGWVKAVEAVTDDGPPYGRASWTLRGAAAEAAHRLTFRCRDRTLYCDLIAGGRTYAPPVVDHGDGWVTELRMRPVRLLGLVPGIEAVGFPPWLVAYLAIVIPVVVVLKRVARIY